MTIEHQEKLRDLLQRAAATKAPVSVECQDATHATRLRNALYRMRASHPLKDRIRMSVDGATLRLELVPDLLEGVKVS